MGIPLGKMEKKMGDKDIVAWLASIYFETKEKAMAGVYERRKDCFTIIQYVSKPSLRLPMMKESPFVQYTERLLQYTIQIIFGLHEYISIQALYPMFPPFLSSTLHSFEERGQIPSGDSS